MFDVNQPQTLEALTKWWNEFKERCPVPDEEDKHPQGWRWGVVQGEFEPQVAEQVELREGFQRSDLAQGLIPPCFAGRLKHQPSAARSLNLEHMLIILHGIFFVNSSLSPYSTDIFLLANRL